MMLIIMKLRAHQVDFILNYPLVDFRWMSIYLHEMCASGMEKSVSFTMLLSSRLMLIKWMNKVENELKFLRLSSDFRL